MSTGHTQELTWPQRESERHRRRRGITANVQLFRTAFAPSSKNKICVAVSKAALDRSGRGVGGEGGGEREEVGILKRDGFLN